MLMLILNVVYVLIAIAIIALVLMQRGTGAAAGSGFGSGASGTVFGARGASNFLSKSTKYLAVAFFGISLFMAWQASHSARPVVQQNLGIMAEQPAPSAPGQLAPQAPSTVPSAPIEPSTVPQAPSAPASVQPAPAAAGNAPAKNEAQPPSTPPQGD